MEEEGLAVLGWRDVPVDADCLGATSRQAMPAFKQLFVDSPGDGATDVELDRKAFVARKRAEHETRRRTRDLLLVAVGAHHRVQGHAHHAATQPVLR